MDHTAIKFWIIKNEKDYRSIKTSAGGTRQLSLFAQIYPDNVLYHKPRFFHPLFVFQ